MLEAHATALHKTDTLSSNHVANEDKVVRCFNLKGLRQSDVLRCFEAEDPRGRTDSLICPSLVRHCSTAYPFTITYSGSTPVMDTIVGTQLSAFC